ncbi:Hypothetical_protein [Hexamita inflata]|uniref:Hypothetical_protein n=1 Tax=Hexamita inflata TaxID=28002 RepID=A0AA86R2I6_9EUKA|nr:Hypothetical protein HINF_LOCUS55632 [Hexamita inflata]
MFNQLDKHQKVTELQKLVGKNSELVKHCLLSTFLVQLTFLVQIQVISRSIPYRLVHKALGYQVITITFSANIEVQILECECIIQINCYFIIRGQGKTNSFNKLQPYYLGPGSITTALLPVAWQSLQPYLYQENGTHTLDLITLCLKIFNSSSDHFETTTIQQYIQTRQINIYQLFYYSQVKIIYIFNNSCG